LWFNIHPHSAKDLVGIQSRFTESFVDDMVVHTDATSDEFRIHLAHIERFLQRIKEVGMTLKLPKMQVCSERNQILRQNCGLRL